MSSVRCPGQLWYSTCMICTAVSVLPVPGGPTTIVKPGWTPDLIASTCMHRISGYYAEDQWITCTGSMNNMHRIDGHYAQDQCLTINGQYYVMHKCCLFGLCIKPGCIQDLIACTGSVMEINRRHCVVHTCYMCSLCKSCACTQSKFVVMVCLLW